MVNLWTLAFLMEFLYKNVPLTNNFVFSVQDIHVSSVVYVVVWIAPFILNRIVRFERMLLILDVGNLSIYYGILFRLTCCVWFLIIMNKFSFYSFTRYLNSPKGNCKVSTSKEKETKPKHSKYKNNASCIIWIIIIVIYLSSNVKQRPDKLTIAPVQELYPSSAFLHFTVLVS
jgi:hypothetical protein